MVSPRVDTSTPTNSLTDELLARSGVSELKPRSSPEAATTALTRLAQLRKEVGSQEWDAVCKAAELVLRRVRCIVGAEQTVEIYLKEGSADAELDALLVDPPAAINHEDATEGPYRATDGGIVWHKSNTETVPLTNFTATIVGSLLEDDGVELRRVLEIEAVLHGRRTRFTTAAHQFANMSWPLEKLGPEAIVYPGQTNRDRARVAVQMLSGAVPERRTYAHTGWTRRQDQWVYLHHGGAIGGDGAVPGVDVSLRDVLAPFEFPTPPEAPDLADAIRSSLRMLELAPLDVVMPIYAAVWRAPLGPCDFAIHLVGPTGSGKTALAALAQQHFGAGFDARHLPGSWLGTANALEGLAFITKDAILVVDDLAPGGTAAEVAVAHREAARLFRAQGNRAGRQRMRADSSLQPTRPPRGLILSTGEDTPRGQSVLARLLVVELPPGALDFERLSERQTDAAAGVYAAAMSGYIKSLASYRGELDRDLATHVKALRSKAHSSSAHRRSAEIAANLMAGVTYFSIFAERFGALTGDEARAWQDRAWEAIGRALAAQDRYQHQTDPVRRYLAILGAALGSGRAHLAARDGGVPDLPNAWGWRRHNVGAGPAAREEWRPQGDRIGWLDGSDIYLDPTAAYGVVQGRDGGEPLGIGETTLRKRLRERGLLASVDEGRETHTVRRVLEGRRRQVLHLHATTLGAPPPVAPDQPDHEATTAPPVVGLVGPHEGDTPDHPDGPPSIPGAA